MRAVLQVCKVLGINGSKSHELNNVERLNSRVTLFKTKNKFKSCKVYPSPLFSPIVLLYQIAKSVMRMSSYNCDHNSVLRATVVLLMQTCSHPLG